MSKFQVAVTFDTVRRKKDRSVTLVFTTNLEINTPEFIIMDTLTQRTGWLVFSENEIQMADIPDVPADEADGKMSPSQEQRWLLKKHYDAEARDIDWPDFYRNFMRRSNDKLKQDLNQ